MAATIKIGGKVKRNLVREFCRVLKREGASLDWGDEPFAPHTEEEILAARVEHEGSLVLQLVNDSALWGQFTQLEEFLRLNSFSFNRRTDCDWGYDGELVQNRRKKRAVSKTDAAGVPVVSVFGLTKVSTKLAMAIKQLEEGRHEHGLNLVKQAKALLHKTLPPEIGRLQSLEFE